MGLRKDFLVHKKKTVESFGFVRSDIERINSDLNNLSNNFSAMGAKISSFDNQTQELWKSINKCLSDNLGFVDSFSFFKTDVEDMASYKKQISKNVLSNSNAIKKLFVVYKAQNSKSKKISMELKKSRLHVKKLEKSFNGKLKIISNRILRVKGLKKSAKRKIVKKITTRKTIKKTITPKKTITEIVTPKKKTVTEVKTS